MTTFDKFYEWCFPHIPSRDKIYAKLVELKVEQEKNKGASMTAIQKMVEWLEVMREKARAETKRGQVLAFAHAADKARRLADEEAKEKPQADAGLVEELKAWIKDSVLNGYATTTGAHQLLDIIIRYRPASQADIVGELKKVKDLYNKAYPHVAPHDCFATGPMTGDYIEDLAICPGCHAQKYAEEIIRKFSNEKGVK